MWLGATHYGAFSLFLAPKRTNAQEFIIIALAFD
jgi:hypothetical protein